MALLLIERLLVKEYYSAYNYERLSDHYVYIPTFCFVLKKRLFLCRSSLKSSKMQRGTPFLVHSNSTTHGGKTVMFGESLSSALNFTLFCFFFPEGTI